ncbi:MULTISPECIES: hypothetical protein [unclassified Actinoplanes]|uniref:hypothetical protein n=1 Tax=unclassified Actinoplanes TaxID=2626549 RepID=UPI0006949A7D|nr:MULTISPECIES: hypothetical protein [unclassified Actinoplanes]
MRGEAGAAVLPLRVATAGESLDNAVALLRRRALPLLVMAAVLAAGEQVLLHRLRTGLYLRPPFYWPDMGYDPYYGYRGQPGAFGVWWQVVATGLATEVLIITLLGAYAGAAAGPALVGRSVTNRGVLRRTPPWSALLIAVVLAAAAWPLAYLGLVGLIVLYGLFGLAVPMLAFDGVNPVRAVVRSGQLSVRTGARVARVRILGYLTWLGIRAALGFGWIAVAGMLAVNVADAGWLDWVVPIAWGIANTVAYAALACLDAVLLVDARIRTEGLDIALHRARARGEDDAAVVAGAR